LAESSLANTCYRLVYYERFTSIEVAIAREKEIKGWRRQKKNKLVETVNPEWKDLASDWYPKELLKDRHSGTI
jgi:predicted GIY-YIG superfamily endonuclease